MCFGTGQRRGRVDYICMLPEMARSLEYVRVLMREAEDLKLASNIYILDRALMTAGSWYRDWHGAKTRP